MKIKPFRNKIQIELENAKSGTLKITTGEIKTEKAKVLAVGDEVKDIEPGDMIYVKAWAIDIIQDGEDTFNFVSEDNDAICAVIKKK